MWPRHGPLALGRPGLPGHRSPEAPTSLQRTLDCHAHCRSALLPPLLGARSQDPARWHLLIIRAVSGTTGLGRRKRSESRLQLRFLRPQGLAEATSEPMFPRSFGPRVARPLLPLQIMPRLQGNEAPGPLLHTGSQWVSMPVLFTSSSFLPSFLPSFPRPMWAA